MKIAILTIAYNEEDIITSCIKNWDGLVDKHLVLISTTPWNGESTRKDATEELAKEMGAETITGNWKTEQEQRNFGLSILKDYDFVLVVDPDELYTKEDQQKIFGYLAHDNKQPVFVAEKMITYWKTTNYVFAPADGHKPVIAVDPRKVYFIDKRDVAINGDDRAIPYREPIPVTVHHLSWVKSDEKVKEKIQSYAHSKDFNIDKWYIRSWLNWFPGSDVNIRPYGPQHTFAAVYSAPEEITNLLS